MKIDVKNLAIALVIFTVPLLIFVTLKLTLMLIVWPVLMFYRTREIFKQKQLSLYYLKTHIGLMKIDDEKQMQEKMLKFYFSDGPFSDPFLAFKFWKYDNDKIIDMTKQYFFNGIVK